MPKFVENLRVACYHFQCVVFVLDADSEDHRVLAVITTPVKHDVCFHGFSTTNLVEYHVVGRQLVLKSHQFPGRLGFILVRHRAMAWRYTE